MLKILIEASLKHKWRVTFIFLFISLLGVRSLLKLPVDAVPDITNVQVMIIAHVGALAPEEIEKSVTYIIESEVAGVPGVTEVRSISKYGLSLITVVFTEDTDLYFARQQLTERLNNVRDALPPGVSPQLGPVSTGLGEIVMYTLRAKPNSPLALRPEKERLLYLRQIQDRIVRTALKSVPGVADIDSSGGFVKQVHVNMDPYKMSARSVSVESLSDYLKEIGINRGGDYIEKGGTRQLVRGLGRLESINDLANLPLSFGLLDATFRLNQIARVEIGGAPRVGAALVHGEEAVLGTVMMRVGENSRTVAQNSTKRLQELHLPDDVETHVLYSRQHLVDGTIRTVEKNLAEGAVLVIVVMFVLIGHVRAALIVALAIPFSMLFAATGMVATGVSANLMSLGALDFGLLVDGSLVVVENCVRRFHLDSRPTLSLVERIKLVSEATVEVAAPVVSGLLIIIVVYIPILTLSDIEGKMFRPMAWTVLFALLGSLIVCLTIVPVLTALFLRKARHGSGQSRIMSLFARLYEPALNFSLRRKAVLPIVALCLLALSVGVFTRLGSDFIPELDEGDLIVGIVRDGDISLAESIRMQKESEKVIARFPEVQEVFSRMGTPDSATDPMGINFSDTFLILEKDRSRWRKNAKGHPLSREELYQEIVKKIDEAVPKQEYSPTQPIEMRFNEMLEGSRADVAIRVRGDDLSVLLNAINRIEGIVKEIHGVQEASMDELTALRIGPVLEAELRTDLLAQAAVHPSHAMDAFITGMAGSQVGSYYEKEVALPIVLRLGDEFRANPAAVGRLPIDLPGSTMVPLSQVMRFRESKQATNIARFNGKRYASVAVFLSGRDVESFVDEAKKKIAAAVKLPKDYEIEWAGQYQNLQEARASILIIVPFLLVLIFGILYQSLGTIRQAGLILLCVPMAATGGVLLLFARGIPFSISASIGFIALSGIAVLNGTVLVTVFNQLRATGLELEQAIKQGAMQRLRPVITTALVASLGFVPMALNSGTGAEVQRPIATVVIGGLISATLLTLGLLPSLYAWIEGRAERNARAGSKQRQGIR